MTLITTEAKYPYLLVVALLLMQSALADEGSQEDILQIYGSQEMISLATGYRQSIADVPAVATVITADQIQRLGALTLAQVLETVPGLHVSSARGVSDIYVIRLTVRSISLTVSKIIQ